MASRIRVGLTALAALAALPSAEGLAQTAAAPSIGYLTEEAPAQRTATSFIGQNVFGRNGERIGDVNDVVVDTSGTAPPALVIGVGGFLGIGEKDVAVPLGAVTIEPLKGARRLVVPVTREDLRAAPPFRRRDPVR
ncbi:PRC-barrel domain-containing protein [Alsobacter sp. R-9]